MNLKTKSMNLKTKSMNLKTKTSAILESFTKEDIKLESEKEDCYIKKDIDTNDLIAFFPDDQTNESDIVVCISDKEGTSEAHVDYIKEDTVEVDYDSNEVRKFISKLNLVYHIDLNLIQSPF